MLPRTQAVPSSSGPPHSDSNLYTHVPITQPTQQSTRPYKSPHYTDHTRRQTCNLEPNRIQCLVLPNPTPKAPPTPKICTRRWPQTPKTPPRPAPPRPITHPVLSLRPDPTQELHQLHRTNIHQIVTHAHSLHANYDRRLSALFFSSRLMRSETFPFPLAGGASGINLREEASSSADVSDSDLDSCSVCSSRCT